MTRNSSFHAFALPDGSWQIESGGTLSARGRRYKRAGHPCFYIYSGALRSVTLLNQTVGRRVPALILDLVELDGPAGEWMLDPDVRRWLKKIARYASTRQTCWLYRPYRKTGRARWRLGDFYSLMDGSNAPRVFSTGPIVDQIDYLTALHELGHLKLQLRNIPAQVLEVEARAWDHAFEHAREQISEQTLAEMLRRYRTYLRYYRKLNRRRCQRWPVPQYARSFVAAMHRYEARRNYALSLAELTNASAHGGYGPTGRRPRCPVAAAS